ncbi:formate dehydrogenase accessory sulfurtransferase FdhD [Agarivorans sp. Z349TD_8]|uniref:formate dehydrogenase accessory sulfurtransferase FdhD n=1 Tax=Agarivorans sp. Z349TD_8 TaxID=3421434 RepID=UPI003D7D7C18
MLKPKRRSQWACLSAMPEQLSHSTILEHGLGDVSLMRFNDTREAEPILCPDLIAIEEPLLLNLTSYCPKQQCYQTRQLSLTMRTPGDDLALVIGLLFSQNIISRLDEIEALQFVSEADATLNQTNHIEVQLVKGLVPDWSILQRNFASYSSCGLCGKSSVQALALSHQASIDCRAEWLDEQLLYQLPSQLQGLQTLYPQTGAVHGAGYFADQQWFIVEEDIGRHNAVDKVLGQLLLQDCYSERSVLVLSGRVSFELMQKVVRANIPVVVAVGAPSSLALAVARQFNISLIGFTKTKQFNVYHAPWRIKYK